jgi:predicted ATPase
LGDRVLAYFGYPRAHEDDAERAVRAGLELITAVTGLKTHASLQTRVGIATGLVVVGDLIFGSGDTQERGIVGETPNLAVRLQSVAEPNMVVVAESTRRLLGNLFELQDLGDRDLEGIAGPVRAWAALRPSSVESRFEALHATGLTALVGREEECELLLRRWSRAKTGEGQVVLLSGEPGIGKSRLTAALLERLAAEPHTRLRYFCSPQHTDSALFPIIGQMQRGAGMAHDDTPGARLDKLDALLAQTSTSIEDAALIAEMLSLPNDGRYPTLDLAPRQRRQRTLEALVLQLEVLTRSTPVLMIFEDAHWTDPTSLELFSRTVGRIRALRVLLLVAFRPEFDPPWLGRAYVTALTINRLAEREVGAMIDRLDGNKLIPASIRQDIIERTDGIPLFIEEMTKAVLEADTQRAAERTLAAAPSPALAVPASLHASLMARLDRLGPAKEVAQIGAAIGREFSYELLAATAQRSDMELREALALLVDAGLVFQRGVAPQATFSFKHALVRDAAHTTLLRASRQRLHARITQALEAQSPELIDTQPELFAYHYTEAGLVEKSVAFWARAGQRSAARSAMAEAAAQFQRGLDQLALLPDAPERRRQELEFCSALGAALMAAKGYAAPETGDAYARARHLWEQLGSLSEFLRIPYGQSLYHAVRGELDLAQRLDEDLLRLSYQSNDSAGLLLGHASSGRNLMFAGRFAASRSHLEEVLAVYDPISHRALVRQAGFHPHVNSGGHLGVVLFCLGYPDQASAQSSAAIAEARRLAHPPSIASSLALGARLLSLGENSAVLGEWVDQLVAVTTEQGLPHWRSQGTIFRGWVKVKNGDIAEGMLLLRSGSADYRATGAEVWMPYHIARLAEACEIAGQIEEAVILLDDALQIAERTGERWFAAELNRLKGQLLLRRGDSEAAENLYRKALSIAEEQEAKLWELRASVSLAQLRHDQGRRTEAHDLLAPIYGWFSEGFDTPDLKEAKALLDELAPLDARRPLI